MENQSARPSVLLLEGLKVAPPWSVPTFTVLLITYCFIMVSNVGVVVLVSSSSKLRQPMYLLLCNMSVNDVLGATIIIPHVLRDVFATERHIRYASCFLQAFSVHLYGSTSHTVLMVMAFDRYMAICDPLRYTAFMTNRKVALLSAAAWGATLLPVSIMLGLTVPLSRCRYTVNNLFCDHASLLKLSCDSVVLNQVYGLGYSVLLLGSSLGSVVLTYVKIAAVCVRSKDKTLNHKALNTCASHLTVYVLLLISAFVVIVLHRFPNLARHRKAAAITGEVVLPALNATIYALQMKELRQRIRHVLRRRPFY